MAGTMMKLSQNLYAETLMKTLGAHAGQIGSASGGRTHWPGLFSLGHGRYRLLAVRLTMEVIGPTASGMKTRPPEPHRRRALLYRVGRS